MESGEPGHDKVIEKRGAKKMMQTLVSGNAVVKHMGRICT
jgi:hypothetical protein